MNQFRLIHITSALAICFALPAWGQEATGAQSMLESKIAVCGADTNTLSSSSACTEALTTANKLCFDTNPETQSAIAAIGGMLSGISGLSSTQQCQAQTNILDIAKTAAMAFNATCGAAKAMADSKCGALLGEATNLKIASCGSPAKPDCSARTTQEKAAEQCKALAGSYAIQLASGAAGLIQLVAQAQQQKNCDKENSNVSCASNPNAPGCGVNCADPANATNATCICQQNPRAMGCAGNVVGEGTSASPLALSNPNSSGGAISPTFDGLDSDLNAISDKPSAAGGAPAAGGGGGSGGAAVGANSKPSGADKPAGINTTVSTGEDGGGGGGGRGRGGGGYADTSLYPNSALRKGMPTLDPTGRGVASSQPQVTGGGGKSNWEKVRDRYRENMGTLLVK